MENILTSYDPVNGNRIGEVEISTPDQIRKKVALAHKAATEWRNLGLTGRLTLLENAWAGAEPHISELAELISREMGKDIQRSSGEASGTVYGGPYIAKEAWDALQPKSVEGRTTIEYGPLGVAAVISPWNYPLAMANNLIVPALMAGNPVVFKPSEETPLVADLFVEILNRVLPRHLLQIVHGDGEQGRALVESRVNLIAFTGSRAVGKDIMARAAGQVKRLVMELGGNDPMIVLADADIGSAAGFAVASSFENAGQMCTSTERIYVDEQIADQFEARVTAMASRYKTGPWNMPGVNIGPIVNKKQHAKIIDHIRDAETKGARVLLGGSGQTVPYIQPTVIADMTPDMVMEQEETFGPVVAMSKFKTVDEAVERANDSPYGLGAVVFGQKEARAVAEQLEAGMIGINQGVGGGGNAPWVGAKQSGFGFHGSPDGHRQFAQVRVVSH
ncbi:MAG: aldehyde dehydrogenase family protein [Desulfobacteraceae bacterium]|nr:aldehyde dehydrogenase family protein [Desulfobacteraceae bacterium]